MKRSLTDAVKTLKTDISNIKNNTYKKYCPNVFVAQCEEKTRKKVILL